MAELISESFVDSPLIALALNGSVLCLSGSLSLCPYFCLGLFVCLSPSSYISNCLCYFFLSCLLNSPLSFFVFLYLCPPCLFVSACLCVYVCPCWSLCVCVCVFLFVPASLLQCKDDCRQPKRSQQQATSGRWSLRINALRNKLQKEGRLLAFNGVG